MRAQERIARLTFHNNGDIELAITRKHRRNYETCYYDLSPTKAQHVLQRMTPVRIYVESSVLNLQDKNGVWIPCNLATVVFYGG